MTDLLDQLKSALTDRYAIEREIGAGGMATVFLARDIKHDRRVAVKVLNPDLGAVLGVDRFLGEIRVTANLQHPNLLPLFDSGVAEVNGHYGGPGLLFYVMPYVEGESLRHRIDREKQLPVDEAIRIATAVASALDYAHRHGVIHRDLKPENILLHDGQPLVADFGIALAVSNAGGTRVTQTGVSLGTPQYMSPEQATGDRAIDGRTDIYSLGAVLYEMLTGDPPHVGSTAQAIIARVLTEKPRGIRASRASVTEQVEYAVGRALEKLPADRWATAREFSEALVNPAFTATTQTRSRAAATTGVSSRVFIAATAGLVLLSAALAAWGLKKPAPSPTLRTRFTLEVPDSQAASLSYGAMNLVVAPNGTEIIYPGRGPNGVVLYRRPLNNLLPIEIPRTDAPANAAYSPDGREIVMQNASLELLRIPLGGGPPTRIAARGGSPSWELPGTILFSNERKLWSVSASGGTPTLLLASDSGGSFDYPHVLPDGKTLIFNRLFGRDRPPEIWLLNLANGSRRRLEISGYNPRYVESGHLLATGPDGSLLATPFDYRSKQILGAAVPVLDQGPSTIGPAKFDVSSNGVLVYAEGFVPVAPATVDRSGRLQLLGFAPLSYIHPRIAPGGDRIAVERVDGPKTDVYILTRATRQVLRITHDGHSRSPEWSPDGSRVFWIRVDDSSATLLSQSADGSGQPQIIPAAPKRSLHRFQVAPSGKFIAMAVGPTRRHDLILIPLDGTSENRQITKTDGDEVQPVVSPDGKWIAYASNEGSNRFEVFISSIENPATRIQVSSEGATAPMWMADGKTLVFCTATHVVAAELRFTPRIEIAKRDTLFTNDYRAGADDRVIDYDAKTRTFLVLASGPNARSKIVVATGWLDEVRERAPRKSKP